MAKRVCCNRKGIQMKVTCGIVLISPVNNSILLCHPTGAPWDSWSIPKGLCDDNETYEQAAIRELQEETGINLTVKPEYIGSYKYNNKKKVLIGYCCTLDRHMDIPDIKCGSFVKSGKLEKFPEVDSFMWLLSPWLKIGSTLLHHTQVELLKDIISLDRYPIT